MFSLVCVEVRTKGDVTLRDMTRHALEFIDTRNVYWKQETPAHVTKSTKNLGPHVRFASNESPSSDVRVDDIINEMRKIYRCTE